MTPDKYEKLLDMFENEDTVIRDAGGARMAVNT